MNTSYPKDIFSRRYDAWEHAYFPFLVEMYGLINDDPVYDIRDMRKFFGFVFANSSGEISKYLPESTENDEDAYMDYLIKKTDCMINGRRS